MSEPQIEKYQITWRFVVEGGEMPPNDTPVLAVVQSAGQHSYRTIIRAVYIRRFAVVETGDFEGDPEYDAKTNEYYWPEGWYEWNMYDEMHYMIDGTITHWAHLPDMPAR